ncbi:MAG: thiamine pyrophosphate-dependent dehydrogenase E1 component subunit alpha [Candidatus Omnitrophica bacterium]|nr:thiamine pyrophosphate-dependent dehydrogenase E1 component subunit alpha [Candidatus Omnitrophota bacterium]
MSKISKINLGLTERFYRSLYRIRKVEEEIARIYPTDKIKSPVHLSIGQEAVSVGICEALRLKDKVFGTYRGHAMYLAKGGDLKKMIAELYGKVTGCAKGKGGSMHLIDTNHGIMGASAIVGTMIPVATGYAYALRYRKSNSLVAAFFGDGAVDEGAFHESLNFAALKKLPILFICENNTYAIHSHHLKRHHSDNIFIRARTYGMPSERIGDGDIFKIYRAANKYIAKIRQGKGPAFLECLTCRWKEHVGPNDDFDLGYRSEDEVSCWKKNDPLKEIGLLLSTATRERIESKVQVEIEEAFSFAEKSPFPSKEKIYQDVFAKSL